ncbi:hypothetical protein GCM10023085_64740 [Actinomadura viridis]|uniref:Mce-associated membrane protein n=1 Tax=Actinomadura viridis TaxID=58110 RepID=A0A931GUF7_9ACTN|nr:hypothetical protein [Actinomadura viridis]MBG6093109.1 Mce-associated membrane protein [Actinomadura viridis]
MAPDGDPEEPKKPAEPEAGNGGPGEPEGGTEGGTDEPKEGEPKADEPEKAAGKKDEPKKDEPEKAAGKESETGKGGTGEREGGERRSGRRVRVPERGTLARTAFVLVLLASVATAGAQWYRADQAASRESDRREVQARAGEFGQALLSYDHRNPRAARNQVLALASDDFAKTYDVAFTGGLEGVITRLKADATATVRAVYLGDVDAASARAIVVMDSEVRSSAGTRRVLGSHLDMRLVRKGERWRVTEVTSIGAANESMTDPAGKQQGGGAPLPGPSPTSGG